MDDVKYLSGKIVLKENSAKMFSGISFEDVIVDSNNSSIIFSDCIFHNDLKIDNANDVLFENCIFLFDSSNKSVSVNVISPIINLENVYFNDKEKANTVVIFNCDYFEGYNVSFDTKFNRSGGTNSCLDIVYSKGCELDTSLIKANKHCYKLTRLKTRILY